jgi:hypothetical protein
MMAGIPLACQVAGHKRPHLVTHQDLLPYAVLSPPSSILGAVPSLSSKHLLILAKLKFRRHY